MQGQSVRQTRRKIEGLTRIFLENLSVSRGGRAIGYPYWHVDLNCGSGHNEKADCDGSPITFLRCAVKGRRRVKAFFFDVDRGAVLALSRRVEPFRDLLPEGSFVWCGEGDNAL